MDQISVHWPIVMQNSRFMLLMMSAALGIVAYAIRRRMRQVRVEAIVPVIRGTMGS